MAVIDPKKLLPESSKTTTILIPKKNVSVSPTSAPALKPADVGESVGGKLVVKKLIKIDEILQDTLKVKKDREKKEGQEKKEDKREKREEALEARKDKKKKADKMFTVPKGKGISWLGNWLTWTVAGFLFNNFMGLLDYLKPFVNIALELGKILYNVFTTIVSGVVSFIELGFNAYNTIEGLIEGLGGEGAKKVFNDMSGALTTAMNVAMIALMVAASTGSGKPGKPGKPGRSGPGGGRPRVTQSGGGNANRFGLRNPLRNRPGVTQGGAGTRVTQAVGNRLTGRGAARVTTSAGSKVAGKLGLKAAGRVLKPILSKVPFVGGLLEFFLSWALGDPIGKAAFRGVGMTLGSWIGGLLGTLIPIPFVGSAIGAFLGGMGAAELAGLMYDGIFGGKNAPKPKVEAKSQGGQVGVKKKPRRGISRRKKKVKVSKVNPVKTFPGKDFTSKQKIEEFYGKDEELDGLGLSSKINTPFDALMDSAKVAKKNNAVNGVIGSLIGTGIDLTLGQKPTSKTIQEISSTLATFVQASMQKEMNSTVDSVKELFSLQQGGSVPESRMISRRKEDPVAVMKQKITRGIASSITKTSSEIFGKIRTAMSGKKEADKARGAAAANNNTYADAPFGSDILVTGGSADFWTLAAIASLEGINPQGQADVAQSIYNRQKAGIYPGGPSLKGLINATDQYSPVRESDPALWAAITDKQSAIAAVESHRNGRGRGKQLVEGSAAAITNRSLQDNAREFVGGRTDFSTPQVMNVDGAHAEYRGTHRASEKTRHNHIFGWFVGPGAVAYGTRVKGKGAAAAVPDLQTMRTAAPTSGIFDGGTGLGGVVKGDPVSQNNFGQFRQYYNNGRGGRHMGVDIAADVGAPLTAVRNGVYMDQDFNSGWGLFSVYKTDNGEYHLYAHQSKRAGKKKGDKIKAGEIIGYCGYSGRVSPPGPAGSHLHWEIGNSWNGYQIGGRYDPLSKYSYKLPFTVGRKTAPRSAPDPVSTPVFWKWSC